MFARRPKASVVTLCCLPLLLLFILREAGAAPTAGVAEEKAKQAYARGAELYQSHHFAAAAAAFSEGYAAKPHHAFLWNLALAYRALGDHEKAIDAYKRYLKVLPATAIADQATAQVALAEEQRDQAAARAAPPAAAPAAAPAAVAQVVTVPVLGHATDGPVADKSEGRKVWRKWWFWTAAGAAVAALGIGLGVGLAPGNTASYREVTWR